MSVPLSYQALPSDLEERACEYIEEERGLSVTESNVTELRSDTFSLPTAEMYAALQSAPLGDDGYEEDPSVNALQARACELTGKEAALFVTSGTQGNLVALLSQCAPGDEIIIGAQSDFLNHEASGLTAVAGVLPRAVDDSNGVPSVDTVLATIRKADYQNGSTTLLALENTHARSCGTPIEPEQIARLADAAHDHGLRVHLDGARLFNAAVALEVPAAAIAASVDTVTFCLSKGLACPAGSLLCGDAHTIERAKTVRKMLGGTMRQPGWLAAAGLVALADIGRLAEDHANARALATALAAVPHIEIHPHRVRTNIVYFRVREAAPFGAGELVERIWRAGVRALEMDDGWIRMVTHRTINRGDVETAADIVMLASLGKLNAVDALAATG